MECTRWWGWKFADSLHRWWPKQILRWGFKKWEESKMTLGEEGVDEEEEEGEMKKPRCFVELRVTAS